MSADLDLLLQRLVADPTKLRSLPHGLERALREHLESALGAEPAVTQGDAPPPVPGSGPDDLLTLDETAAVLRVSRRWLYRHARQLPFARKLSPKVLRFSRSGAARWLAGRRP
jgi:predicted DNA-binding transcriptional regulator AlpA